ncbi:MAG: HNH endonuclease signature motif containing protein, partial [Kiloniellales bacterium]
QRDGPLRLLGCLRAPSRCTNIPQGKPHDQREGRSLKLTLVRKNGAGHALSGCPDVDVLEAAHIYPFKGDHTNVPSNGILMRADLHTLFDLGRLSVNPENYLIKISSTIQNKQYRNLDGKKLRLPRQKELRPSKKSLRYHFDLFHEKEGKNEKT